MPVAGHFHWANWLIVLGYLTAIAAVGFWFARRNRNAEQYFKGAGDLPWWAVALSMYAAMFSSITFLSIPALAYASDLAYLPIVFGAYPAVGIACRWYLPFFHRLNLTSAYEYLERRFGLGCRLFGSAAFILFMISSIAVVTYLPVVALTAVTGLDANLAIVVVMTVTIVYSVAGGLEAVVWSDFVQGLLLFGSMALIAVLLVVGSGGLAEFVRLGNEGAKFRVFDWAFDWTRPTFWVVLIGGFVANFVQYSSDQRMVQRYLAVKELKGAVKSAWAEAILGGSTSGFCFLIGVGIWVYYHVHPELMPSLAKNDQILPVYIAQVLPNGVSGLVFAAVAAATVSTLAANLNSAASAFTTDFWVRLREHRGGVGEQSKLRCARVSTLAAGLLGGAMALGLANADVYSIFEEFQRFLGILTSGLGALFLMGLFMPRVNGRGAMCGLVANYGVTFGLNALPFAGKPHLLLYGLIGLLVCLVVAPLASWALAGRTEGGG